MAHITKRELDNLCDTLRAADADIRDIVMFGSFVYAPSLARGHRLGRYDGQAEGL